MQWQVQPAERSLLLPTVAVRLRDDFSGHPPFARVDVELEQEVDGEWRAAKRKLVRTPGGIAYFPNLGRAVDPIGVPKHRYRVRVRWPFGGPLYEGGYPSGQAGAVFELDAWNRDRLPASSTAPQSVFLLPGPAYPFPPEVAVFRGQVRDAAGKPVSDVLVEQGSQERALSDARGQFALALRWVAPGPVDIDFRDHLGRTAVHTLTVPDDLGAGHEITIA